MMCLSVSEGKEKRARATSEEELHEANYSGRGRKSHQDTSYRTTNNASGEKAPQAKAGER